MNQSRRYRRRAASPKANNPAELSTTSKVNRYVDRHLVGRMPNLIRVWRLVVIWLMAVALVVFILLAQLRSLQGYYTKLAPSPGGTYVEAVIGPLTNINPIYASTAADKAAARLIFASLLKYDVNSRLAPDLALSITSDDKGSRYTIKLRPDLVWHDGQPLEADDVVFTVQAIQDPKARSPLHDSLQGVTVEAVDDLTVIFSLPASFSPFPNLLTFGILPEHVLARYPAQQLRSLAFNSSEALGSGPFKLQRLVDLSDPDSDQQEIKLQLIANPDYHLGQPLLEAFSLWVVPSQARLIELLKDNQLTATSGLDWQLLQQQQIDIDRHLFDLTSGVYLFYKSSSPLLAELKLRRAISQAVNPNQIIRWLDYPVQLISGPLLAEHLGYDPQLSQPSYDPDQANKILQELGWRVASDNVRINQAGQRLSLLLTTQRGTAYQQIAEEIAKQLKAVGIEVGVDLRDGDGFAKNVLQEHAYDDLLLYGINLGADPDVFAFWHSSQADFRSSARLNLAEYISEVADEALESGRSRVEVDLRSSKYQLFQQTWLNDLPALALYRPKFSYYELANVRGPRGATLVNQQDYFRDVHLWTVLTTRVDHN